MGDIADDMRDQIFEHECEWCGAKYPKACDEDCPYWEEKKKKLPTAEEYFSQFESDMTDAILPKSRKDITGK